MLEALFILYLFSGIIKGHLYSFGISTGVDLTLLFGGMLMLATVYKLKTKAERADVFAQVKSLKSLWCLAGFFVWMAITLTYSTSDAYGYKKVFLYVTNLIPVAFVGVHALRVAVIRKGMTILSVVLGIAFFFLHALTLYAKQRHYPWIDFDMYHGIYMSYGVLLASTFILLLEAKKTWQLLMLVNFLMYAFFYTGSRGAIIFFFVIAGATFIMKKWWKVIRMPTDMKKVGMIAMGVLLLNVGMLASINSSRYAKLVYYRSFARMGLAFDSLVTKDDPALVDVEDMVASGEMTEIEAIEGTNGSRNRSIVARVWHLKFSYRRLTEEPARLLYGFGIGSYSHEIRGKDGRAYPHNQPVEILFELGVIGLLLFGGFLLFGASVIDKSSFGLIAICVFLLLNTLKSGSIIDERLFYGCAALLIFKRK